VAKVDASISEKLRLKHGRGDPFALYDAVFFHLILMRADEPFYWAAQTMAESLRLLLIKSKEGRDHVKKVKGVFKRRLIVTARFATVYWLRKHGVEPYDDFVVAGNALNVGDSTIRNSYHEFKKKQGLPRKYDNPFFEKTSPSEFPYGPSRASLERALSRYKKTGKAGL
jgi:hypothetical protein